MACALALDLVADRLLGLGPVAVERGDQVAVGRGGQFGFFQEAPRALLSTSAGVVLQACEEVAPFGVDRGGVVLVAGVEVFDVGGVAAIEEGGAGEGCVGVLAGHGPFDPCGGFSTARRERRRPDETGIRRRTARFNSIYDACKSTKDLRTESAFQHFDQGFADAGPATATP